MKAAKTLSRHPAVFLLLPLALPWAAPSQTRMVNATIDISKTSTPISTNIYDQFLEHGGDIVNSGIWSEMLVDRKFLYLVAAGAPTPPPLMGNAAGNPRFRRTPTRWWASHRRRQRGHHKTPNRHTLEINRRWLNSTPKSRVASASPELQFAKTGATQAASC